MEKFCEVESNVQINARPTANFEIPNERQSIGCDFPLDTNSSPENRENKIEKFNLYLKSGFNFLGSQTLSKLAFIGCLETHEQDKNIDSLFKLRCQQRRSRTRFTPGNFNLV